MLKLNASLTIKQKHKEFKLYDLMIKCKNKQLSLTNNNIDVAMRSNNII